MGNKKSTIKLKKDLIQKYQTITKLSEDEIQEWYQEFYKECPDGKLTKTKFRRIFIKYFRRRHAKSFCDAIFNLYDRDTDGSIDFEEFLIALSPPSQLNIKDHIERVPIGIRPFICRKRSEVILVRCEANTGPIKTYPNPQEYVGYIKRAAQGKPQYFLFHFIIKKNIALDKVETMSLNDNDNASSVSGDYVSDRIRTDSGQNYAYDRTLNIVGGSSTGDIVHTTSASETDRYLDSHGISLCKSPNVIQRTEYGASAEYEQRVCLRYLQPPPLPPPGPLTIEEIRKPGPPGSILTIREQPTIVDAPPPLVLRERPPTPPIIPGPERKTVYISSDSIQERSIVIERYPAIQEKPRDIIIERWLPYGPLPEREIIRKRIGGPPESKGTCTIINYENPHSHVNRRFAVVDVYNADPRDYTARYRDSLLDSTELLQQVRRLGVNEDISSPSTISTSTRVDRKRVDYLQSRNSLCDCFTSDVISTGAESGYGRKSRYHENGNVTEISSTTKYQRRND
ncbi:hypothetical protein I4U23_027372 [Adineta vaga]|nr:hypothetical protein I4U23_027372 [Adineta vaga]